MELVTETSPNNFTLNINNSSNKSSSINSAESTVNKDNKYCIATDCDDVLVNITDKWILSAHRWIPEMRPFIDPFMDTYNKYGTFLIRSEYYLLDYLGVKDEALRTRFNNLYFNDPFFYDNLQPLPFMRSLKNMRDTVIGTIHVVTTAGESTPTLPANISKAKWLLRHFKDVDSNINVNFHFLDFNKGKGEYMVENNISFNTFIDDSSKNITEVINSTPYSNYEIMIPAYGFNQNLEKMKEDITSEQSFKVTSFHNFNHISQEKLLELVAA